MADSKVSGLGAATELDGDDLLYVVEDGVSKRVELAKLASFAASSDAFSENASFLSRSKNLFDKSSAEAGLINAAGNIQTSETYSVSDYIPVEPEQEYYGRGHAHSMRTWCFYSDIGTVLAGGSNTVGNTFTTPAGCAYVRISFFTTQLESFQLEAGSSRTAYSPHGYTLNRDGYRSIVGWDGLKWGAMGDSITANKKWLLSVSDALNMNFADYGVSGTRVSGSGTTAMCSDNRVNAIATDCDLLTVMGGVNDWSASVPLGAETSTNVTEFNGALNTLISKLLTRLDGKTIALVTQPYTERTDYASVGWANAYTNLNGLAPVDYADATRAACRRWNIPVIDVQQNCGWNAQNITTWVEDDGSLLHPKDIGYARIAAIHVGALRSIAPVVLT